MNSFKNKFGFGTKSTKPWTKHWWDVVGCWLTLYAPKNTFFRSRSWNSTGRHSWNLWRSRSFRDLSISTLNKTCQELETWFDRVCPRKNHPKRAMVRTSSHAAIRSHAQTTSVETTKADIRTQTRSGWGWDSVLWMSPDQRLRFWALHRTNGILGISDTPISLFERHQFAQDGYRDWFGKRDVLPYFLIRWGVYSCRLHCSHQSLSLKGFWWCQAGAKEGTNTFGSR